MKDERILVRKEKRRNEKHLRKVYVMKCLGCGKEFEIPVWEFNQGRGRFCSRECYHKTKIPNDTRRILVRTEKQYPRNLGCNQFYDKGFSVLIMQCLWCKRSFRIPAYRFKEESGKFCSHECFLKWNKGKNHSNWKGGKFKTTDGYILCLNPKHPYARNSYVREHRLVMEQKLGRYLEPQERTHHVNGIKDDNRQENLIYFPDDATHKNFHWGKDLIYFPKGCLLDDEEVWLQSNDLVKLLT